MVVRGPASKVSLEQAEERFLLEAAQKDPSRFGELYENNFERAYAFGARIVRERQVAADLTGAAFHKALPKLSGSDSRGLPLAACRLRLRGDGGSYHWQR